MKYKELIGQIIPKNLSVRSWIADILHIKGGHQTFASVAELVAFHPEKLKKGQSVNVSDYPGPNQIAEFRLKANPSTMVDVNKDSIVTNENFLDYWNQQTFESIQEQSADRIYQYAAPFNGGLPPFPYKDNPLQEPLWEDFYDATRGHAYVRFRTDDEDLDEDGIFDNWTRPFPIGTSFETGDYIENRYLRQNVSAVNFNEDNTQTQGTDPLVDTKYYQVITDETVTVNGEVLTRGRRFQYNSGDVVVFNDPLSTLNETLAPPPRTIIVESNVVPNNEPKFTDGRSWLDEPTIGIDQLWEITAQKTVYGNLKSDWKIRKVIESPDLTRYSRSSSPNPDTLVGTTSKADPTGTVDEIANDQLLTDNGWLSAYSKDTIFIAYREEISPGLYTNWLIDKISEESGEYIDRVYRLFPYVIDNDDQLLIDNTPQTERPYDEGWFDGPQPETDTEINYVSEARRFFDGALKTTWSRPVPFTGKDVFTDIIISDSDNYFRTDPNNPDTDPQNPATIPETITLTCQLFKGTIKLWERQGAQLSFSWRQVTDNGNALPDEAQYKWDAGGGALYDEALDPSTLPENIYALDSFGTPGNPGYLFDYQRIRIKPNGITATSTFECTIVFTLTNGKSVDFVSRFTIADLSDGLDAETLYLNANAIGFTKTTNRLGIPGETTTMEPPSIILKANFTNLVTENQLTWQIEDGPDTWVDLLTNVTSSTLVLSRQGDNTVDITTAGILTSGSPNATDIFSVENARRFKVTHPLLPEGDIMTVNHFIVETTDGKDGDKYATTSTTSLTIPESLTDQRTFTVDEDLSYTQGQTVIIYYDINNQYEAEVVSYTDNVTSGTLVVEMVDLVPLVLEPGNSGVSLSPWSINLTGAKGETGDQGIQGIGNIRPILGNENITLVLNSESLGVSPANQIGNNSISETPIYVVQGGTKISTSFWQFINTGVDDNGPSFDDGGTVTGPNGAVLTIEEQGDPSERRAYISLWPEGVRSDYFDLQIRVTNAANGDTIDSDTVNAGSQPLDITVRYTIATSVDAPGAKQLIVVSDSGLAFTKANDAAKNLRADYFDSGAGNDVLTTGYYYRWTYRNSADAITAVLKDWTSDAGGGRLQSITRGIVNGSQRFAVDVTDVSSGQQSSDIIRTTFFQIDDVADGDVILAYYGTGNSTAPPSKPSPPAATTQQAYDALNTVGNDIWTKEGGTVATWFACIGNLVNEVIEWGSVFQVRGERGNQGPNGDGYVYLYKKNDNSIPSTTASIATMISGTGGGNWLFAPPVANSEGDIIYQAQARFNGSDFSDFEANGIPRNSANTDYSPIVGTWSVDILYERATNGNPGTPGKGWTGGSYNASTGIATFTSDDGLGFSTTDLRGANGTDGEDGTNGTNGTNGVADGVLRIAKSNYKTNGYKVDVQRFGFARFDTLEQGYGGNTGWIKDLLINMSCEVENISSTAIRGYNVEVRVANSASTSRDTIVTYPRIYNRYFTSYIGTGTRTPISLNFRLGTNSRYIYILVVSTATSGIQPREVEGTVMIGDSQGVNSGVV